jgi:hypothetical protein
LCRFEAMAAPAIKIMDRRWKPWMSLEGLQHL